MVYLIKIFTNGNVFNNEAITSHLKKDKRIINILDENNCIIAQSKRVMLEDNFKSFVYVFQMNFDKNKQFTFQYLENSKVIY